MKTIHQVFRTRSRTEWLPLLEHGKQPIPLRAARWHVLPANGAA
jgi:hypothetical protein